MYAYKYQLTKNKLKFGRKDNTMNLNVKMFSSITFKTIFYIYIFIKYYYDYLRNALTVGLLVNRQ